MSRRATSDPAAELLGLMASTAKNELECREYLFYAQERLVRATPIRFLPLEEEFRGHFGDSDYLVRCISHDEVGVEHHLAYLWEVKAPQCCLFERDTENRAKPSWDLVSAENQLLHYYHELNNNHSILRDFGIIPGDLHLGGIIIGAIKNFAGGSFRSREEGTRLSLHAYELRSEYFYRGAGIEVITWDRIVEHIQRTNPVSGAESAERIPDMLIDNPIEDVNMGESVLVIVRPAGQAD